MDRLCVGLAVATAGIVLIRAAWDDRARSSISSLSSDGVHAHQALGGFDGPHRLILAASEGRSTPSSLLEQAGIWTLARHHVSLEGHARGVTAGMIYTAPAHARRLGPTRHRHRRRRCRVASDAASAPRSARWTCVQCGSTVHRARGDPCRVESDVPCRRSRELSRRSSRRRRRPRASADRCTSRRPTPSTAAMPHMHAASAALSRRVARESPARRPTPVVQCPTAQFTTRDSILRLPAAQRSAN